MHRIDISDIEGSYCYCCDEASEIIRLRLQNVDPYGVHYIGTGDYHYLSLFMMEKICEDFDLVLLDNHPDDMDGAFDSSMISCGNWAGHASATLPHLKNRYWNDVPRPDGLPVFLSIDLDVLSPEYAHTDWDQGDLSIGGLLDIVKQVKSSRHILGADICGGLKSPRPEDISINERAISLILSILEN